MADFFLNYYFNSLKFHSIHCPTKLSSLPVTPEEENALHSATSRAHHGLHAASGVSFLNALVELFFVLLL